MTILLQFLCVLCLVLGVQGHGRLMDPPQRSSMWRKNFTTPRNYNDNQLNCGGQHNQWSRYNKGRCGPCGDPYESNPRDNEPGGKYYSAIIGRVYDSGDTVDIEVQITANHRGFFEFRLCDNGDLDGDDLQRCFDKYTLTLDPHDVRTRAATPGGPLVRFVIGPGRRTFVLRANLPPGVACDYCVLQWKYVAGNSWGRDDSGVGLGHGPQEHFINCANIQIRGRVRPGPWDITTQSVPSGICHGVGVMAQVRGIHEWCALMCPRGQCPSFMCSCS